jgi:hypothetical protein
MRPDHRPFHLLRPEKLSLKALAHRYVDPESQKRVGVLDQQLYADLFGCLWQVEIFLKWINQHLRIKTFYGTTENAVKTQIRIAIAGYVLVAIVKKTLNLDQSLYTLFQILSVTLFEKTPISRALPGTHNNRTEMLHS